MNRRHFLASAAGAIAAPALLRNARADEAPFRVKYFPVPDASRSRDVTPCSDGTTMWFNCQGNGKLGRLDPRDGSYRLTDLGPGSAPHGVIVGPDGAAWVTDGGLNAIVRVDPGSSSFRGYRLPAAFGDANLNTATFDKRGILWFTGQNGIYGRLNPKTGAMHVFRAPLGSGPYGITTTPKGQVFYASLAGSHIAQIDVRTGKATVIRPPTAGQGARRVWSDSKGRIWVSEWNAGKVGRYDPATKKWREWRVPGPAQIYAVYVDDKDMVWLTDFGRSGLWRFAPATAKFTRVPLREGASVRQLLGRPGEVWGAESGTDRLVVV